MQHEHYWRIVRAEVWTGDRFHLHYECDCGDQAEGAYGIVGKKENVPRVITKLIPGLEEHLRLTRSE